jgi:Reverse transcriptase (RNA-dependent DNA polymerase)
MCKEQIQAISVNNVRHTDPRTIASFFNEFFTNVASSIVNDIIPTDRPPDLSNINNPVNFFSFSDSPVTCNEIIEAIGSLEPKKTQDVNGLSIFFISKFAMTLSVPLKHILSASFTSGIFPDQLKVAKVVPIFKSGDKLCMNNYRPISLLNVFSKIFEKIVCSRLTNFLETNKLISSAQFGFRKNHSTTHPLTKFLNLISKFSNDSKHTIAIFCDLKKAFDTCNHEILLSKMFKLGIRGVELKWFKNYLSNRKQFVSINGHCSSLRNILIGVPQGSILGPLLFLIYINDLPLCSKLISLLFADDTTLIASNQNFDELVKFVQSEFKKVTDYFRYNKLSLHPQKTNFMIFSPNQNVMNKKIELFVDNNNVSSENPNYCSVRKHAICQITTSCEVPAVKFLGVYIDPQLNFKFHIKQLSMKISKSLFFIKKSKFFLTSSSLKALYYSLVHCHLTYALPVWSSTIKSNLNSLIKLQKNALRIISNSAYNAHTEPIFKELKILPLPSLIKCTSLQFMHQYVNGFLPQAFQNEWPTNADLRGENLPILRNQDDLFIPFARSCFADRMPYFNLPKLWSSFNVAEIKFIRDKNSFKINLKKHLLGELSSIPICNRLLCPRCHLQQ